MKLNRKNFLKIAGFGAAGMVVKKSQGDTIPSGAWKTNERGMDINLRRRGTTRFI